MSISVASQTYEVDSLQSMNLPQLSTTFTPPQDCKDGWIVNGANETQGFTISSGSAPTILENIVFSTVANYPILNQFTTVDLNYQSCQAGQADAKYHGYVCPSGHTTAGMGKLVEEAYASSASSPSSTFQYWRIDCCLSGMSLREVGVNWTPSQTASPSDTTTDHLTAYYCFSSFSTPLAASSLSYWPRGGYWESANTTTMTQGYALANPIMLFFEEKDLSSMPTPEASSLAKLAGIDYTAAPASTSTLPRETGAPAQGNQLSTGGKAGIGVGAVAGALLVGMAIFFILRRRRKTPADPTIPTTETVAEMEDQDKNLANRKWFLGGKWRNESAAEEQQHELDSRGVVVVPGPPVELEGSHWNAHEEGAFQQEAHNRERPYGS